MCILYDREPNPEWPGMWTEHLEGLPGNGIVWAFRQLEKTFIPTLACPFPVPAHVRELLERPAKLALDRAAELAWQTTLEAINQHYHPDLGWRGPALAQPDAVNAAGGIDYLWRASATKLIWAKKAFLESYLRDEQLKQYGEPAPEIRKLLAETLNSEPAQDPGDS